VRLNTPRNRTRTAHEPQYGTFVMCDVCFCEDDDVQLRYPDSEVGANAVSLNQARRNFLAHRVSELRFKANVRPPLPEEQP
jgi:Cysteine-rich CPCC